VGIYPIYYSTQTGPSIGTIKIHVTWFQQCHKPPGIYDTSGIQVKC